MEDISLGISSILSPIFNAEWSYYLIQLVCSALK
ncbi:MAG: hypothetical protein CM1200mP33_7100 [Chloroflexota bacterium]|nr:MAG: hypothetical protein CM1200mP33_7100 [Chloroflexota bacterium]